MKKIIKNNLLMIKYIVRFCPKYMSITLINAILSSVTPVFYILFTRYIVNSITDSANFKFISLIILLFLLYNICYSFLIYGSSRK